MLRLKRIGIADVGPYKDKAQLTVTPGVTVVYGKNKLSSNNANFVGKSLLVRSIEELIYDPVVRQDKKTGSRFLTFVADKKRVDLESLGSNITIKVDGEEQERRKKTDAKELIRELWPISPEEFSTYVYVDALSSHPLVKGTSTVRKAFFNSFFQLDRLDKEKKIFAKKLTEVKRSKAAYDEIAKSIDELRGDLLTKQQREELEEKIRKLTSKTKRMSALASAHMQYQRLMQFKKIAKPMLGKTARPVKEVKRDLRNAESQQEAMKEYEDYLRDLKRYQKATEGLDMKKSLKSLKATYDRYQELQRFEEPIKPRKNFEKVPNPKVNQGEVRGKLRELDHQLSHAEKSSKGKCYACGQPIKLDAGAIRKKIKQYTELLEQSIEYESYLDLKASYDAAISKYQSDLEEYNEASDLLESMRSEVALYEKRKHLQEPEPVDKPEGSSGKTVEELKEELRVAEFLEEHEDELAQLAKNPQPVEYDPAEYNQLMERLSSYKAKLEVHNTLVNKARSLKERLIAAEKAVKDEAALSLIVDSYSDKAVKRMIIEAISARLMETVNKYASLVMPGYKFEFVWDSNINILVKRGNSAASDVRKLSGAESMLFTLILVLALLVFVPKNKRTNVLILDEPTASMSDTSIELFMQLLPHLTTIIPSVIIVTPKKMRFGDARCVTVVQETSGSKVIEGHPDDL